MDKKKTLSRFSDLTYEDFKYLAEESSLGESERIGFPGEYRDGREADIFEDISSKLSFVSEPGLTVLDIGVGCGALGRYIVEQSVGLGQELLLLDSLEVLSQLPDGKKVRKFPGQFPQEQGNFLQEFSGKVDSIICYSVFHYIFQQCNGENRENEIFSFLDSCLSLLRAGGGEMLLGDIPNISQRKRFFSSEAGIAFHKKFMNTQEPPKLEEQSCEAKAIDDTLIFSLVLRARKAGYHAYVLEQDPRLPMANRREDLLFKRP